MEQCHSPSAGGRCLNPAEAAGYCPSHSSTQIRLDGRISPLSSNSSPQGLSAIATAQRIRAEEEKDREYLIRVLVVATGYSKSAFTDLSLQDIRNIAKPFLRERVLNF